MNKRMLPVVLSLFLVASPLMGCQEAAKKPMTPQQQTPPKNSNMDASASERRVMASRLSKIAQDVPGVNKASIVVTNGVMAGGGTNAASVNNGSVLVVLAGLTITPTLASDATQVSGIKKNVADRVKANDNRISEVLVTTDPTMIKRINDVAAGIIEGKPVQSYETNVDTLARDLKKPNQTF